MLTGHSPLSPDASSSAAGLLIPCGASEPGVFAGEVITTLKHGERENVRERGGTEYQNLILIALTQHLLQILITDTGYQLCVQTL